MIVLLAGGYVGEPVRVYGRKMLWLNRLQQRLSLTRNEAVALLSLSALLITGLVARHVQQRAVPVPVGAYDEMDRLFFQRSESADTLPGSPLTDTAGDDAAAVHGPVPSENPGSHDRAAGPEGPLADEDSGDDRPPSPDDPFRPLTPDVAASDGPSTPDDAASDGPSTPDDPDSERTLGIDLNTAGTDELTTLPRIGPKLAERILAFRADYGLFYAVDDLQQVRGIGEKTVESIRPHVYVSVRDEALHP